MNLSSQPKLKTNLENEKSSSISPSLIRIQVLLAVLLSSGCMMADRIGITMCRQGNNYRDEIALQKKAEKLCDDGKGKLFNKNGYTCMKCDSKRGVKPDDIGR